MQGANKGDGKGKMKEPQRELYQSINLLGFKFKVEVGIQATIDEVNAYLGGRLGFGQLYCPSAICQWR